MKFYEEEKKEIIEEGTIVTKEKEEDAVTKEEKEKKTEIEKEIDKKVNKEQKKVFIEEQQNLEKEKSTDEVNTKQEENKTEEKKIEYSKVKTSKTKMLISFVFCFVIIVLTISTMFALLNIGNSKFLSGITISGVNLKGMTKENARIYIDNKMKSQEPIKLKVENKEYEISQEEIEVKYNIQAAIEKAYKIGRGKNLFINNYEIVKALIIGENIEIEASWNEEVLDGIIGKICNEIPNSLEQYTYSIEDNKLMIKKGKNGNTIDIDKTKQLLKNKIINNDGKTIEIETIYKMAEEIDIEEIHKKIYKEAKDAYYVEEPFQLYAEVEGLEFNIEEAKELLKKDSEQFEIPLTVIIPEVTIESIGDKACRDLLGTFTTKYSSKDSNRTTNLKLAVQALDGVIVQSEEVFSYNKTLGPRTYARGYKNAAGYSGGKVVQTVGGGICQVSSTLYDAVVYSNLEIVERANHAFLTSYTTAGRDATVSYGTLDFKFKNTRKYPIMIKASAENGIITIEIYGVKEEEEYEIEIVPNVINYISPKTIYEDDNSLGAGEEKVTQRGMNGCNSITYKVYKQNGVEVRREVLSQDRYNAMNKIVKRGVTTSTPEVEKNTPEPEVKEENIIKPLTPEI